MEPNVWKMIDQTKLHEELVRVSYEMQHSLPEYQKKALAENDGFLSAEQYLELEVKKTNDWAEKEFSAALEIWKSQGYEPTSAFYRAVFDNLLVTLFNTRISTIKYELERKDRRTRRSNRSMPLQKKFVQSMEKLKFFWSQKLDGKVEEK